MVIKKDSIEKDRLKEVRRFLKLDFSKSSDFQDIVDLAALLCEKPVALITILDEDVNWIKVRSGVEYEVMPRETSFCQYGIQQDEILIIPDATKDYRFDDNPLVQSNPHVRFYAGAPLILNNGLKLGTLCLFDLKPNKITPLQEKTLSILSRQVTYLMELKLGQALLKKQLEETEAKNKALRKISFMQSHDIRHPLSSIMCLVNLVKDGIHPVDEHWLGMITEATDTLDNKIKAIVNETAVDRS